MKRYDTAPIKGLTVDQQTGFLHIPNVPITRVGVFPYLKADGTKHYEAKLPGEVLSDSTVSSANNKIITDDHPKELVTKDNVSKYSKGFTAENAHVDSDVVRVDMTITHKDLINKILNGDKRELSIGFETELVPKQGKFDSKEYDYVQHNIRINHVAVVQRGRAGHQVSLVGDSAEMVEDEQKGESMKLTTVLLGDETIQVADEDATKVASANAESKSRDQKIADYKKQITALEAKIKDLQGSNDEATKNANENKAKADSAEKELAKVKGEYESLKDKYTGDSFENAIEKSIELRNQVKPYLGDSYDFKGKSSKQLKLDAIDKMGKSYDGLADKSDEIVDAYFDGLTKNAPTTGYMPNYNANSDADNLIKMRNASYHLASQKKGE